MRPRLLALALPAKLATFATFAALSPLGCVTSIQPGVDVADAPTEDGDYAPSLTKATQDRIVLKDFETRWGVTATYLSPEFRGAFARRLSRVYMVDAGSSGPHLDEASSKAGFLVSMRASDNTLLSIDNPQHWTVLLTPSSGTAIKPVLVKRLTDKERWRAFFVGVDPWTVDFLVVFDTPSVDTASPALVEKSPMRLTFANADGKVHLDW